jgi:hypothetical protein
MFYLEISQNFPYKYGVASRKLQTLIMNDQYDNRQIVSEVLYHKNIHRNSFLLNIREYNPDRKMLSLQFSTGNTIFVWKILRNF